MYDVVIAGGGPAGMSAAIYAARAGLKTLMLERSFAGGQIVNTPLVENYPGFNNDVSGAELAMDMHAQAQKMGAEIKVEEIVDMVLEGPVKNIVTAKSEYKTRTVILAMGAVPRLLGVKGEMKFNGSGVSFCATCDGALFKGKDVAVVGGGNTAVEDALHLAKLCNKVYLIHRRDKFRAQNALVQIVRKTDNIECVMESVATEVTGEFSVDKIALEHVKTKEARELDVAGVFIAVGQIPKSDLVAGVIPVDETGYIIANESCRTPIEGVYCAGDIRTKRLRQIVTAVCDGAVAATAAENYLIEY